MGPMHPVLGWLLVAAIGAASWAAWGWRGVAIAASAIVFWMLMQFNRTVRVMQDAAQRPVGHVPSAVMFHAGLRPGLTMLQVVKSTGTLGKRAEGPADDWVWSDDGGVAAHLRFERGALASWRIERPAGTAPAGDGPPA